MLETQDYKETLSRFASGVTVVTTISRGDSVPVGFTASAFTALSLEPPLVLVSLDTSAQCHSVFAEAPLMAISVLANTQADIAMRFANRDVDKFESGTTLTREGLPVVENAQATLVCGIVDVIERGDHSILVGAVYAV